MMRRIEDCRGRCVCFADSSTGLVEFKNRNIKGSAIVEVGASFVIQRDDTETRLIRVSRDRFELKSRIIA